MFWIPSQLEGAYVGQDVTIECHSEAFPDSINYWVKKDGVMLLLSKSTLSVLIVYSTIGIAKHVYQAMLCTGICIIQNHYERFNFDIDAFVQNNNFSHI